MRGTTGPARTRADVCTGARDAASVPHGVCTRSIDPGEDCGLYVSRSQDSANIRGVVCSRVIAVDRFGGQSRNGTPDPVIPRGASGAAQTTTETVSAAWTPAPKARGAICRRWVRHTLGAEDIRRGRCTRATIGSDACCGKPNGRIAAEDIHRRLFAPATAVYDVRGDQFMDAASLGDIRHRPSGRTAAGSDNRRGRPKGAPGSNDVRHRPTGRTTVAGDVRLPTALCRDPRRRGSSGR